MAGMLRFIGRSGTAGAAAGLASAPAIAECRAPTASVGAIRRVKVDDPGKPSSGDCCCDTSEQSWLTPELVDGEVLGFEEVDDALADVLSIAAGRSHAGCGSVNGGDDASSVDSFGAEADHHIETFDTTVGDARPQLSSVMHTLLNNREVQHAVAIALRDSPEFEQLLSQPELEHFQLLYATELLPPAATAALERKPTDPRNVLEKGLELAAQGLAALGESIAGVGDGVAAFLGNLANSVRQALPNRATAKQAAASEDEGAVPQSGQPKPTRAALLSGALFSLAVAVIALVLFKRAGVVRIVRMSRC